MSSSHQPNLFDETEPESIPSTGFTAEIVFDRPVDQVYTYAIPQTLRAAIAVGKRVLAPFGKGNQESIGYCVSVHEATIDRSVKSVTRVLDDEVLLSDNQLRLTRWMADYYLCAWGQVLNAVVPASVKNQAGTRLITLLEPISEGDYPQPFPELSSKQQQAWEHLKNHTAPMSVKDLGRLAQCGPSVIDALVEKRLVRRTQQRRDTLFESAETTSPAEAHIELNPDQLRAWLSVESAIRQGGFRAFLLYGVTGSGKTEIYLRAMEEVVRLGKEVIVLVPEISLTPQTIQRFRGRSGSVAVLHSHLRDAERGGHWRRIAAGQVEIVVGARSAVFAPTRNLGLIVIDEEHENSFKQESTPRYHARDVAVMRARLEGIPIILGSATPSLESWHNAQRGQYERLTLPQRVLDRPLPQVSLIDLRHEPPPRSHFHALSNSLERAMHEELRAGGQVILLLNRRGFSTYVSCPRCGHVAHCQFCDLAMTYHRERAVMLCHSCGYEQEPLQICPQCKFATIHYQGVGTEKLQAEIEDKFSGYVARRMDSDTMRVSKGHERVLTAFRNGLIHILLGTQMIAKGLDFPNVTLVGVVNADVGLHIPDFRSAERTFQLLSQVAGRAGRGPRGGRVLVQTMNPEQPCIALAAKHDYLAFVAEELAHRREHRYPPYQRMARLIVRSRDEAKAASAADRLADHFNAAMRQMPATATPAAPVRLLGPAEAPVFRLKGYYRFHFQLQSPSSATMHQLLRAVLPTMRLPGGVEYTLDVDPMNML